MTIKIYDSIKSAKSEFPDACQSAYSSYAVLRAVEKCVTRVNLLLIVLMPWRFLKRLICRRCRFFVCSVSDEKGLILLAPLFVTEDGMLTIAGYSHNIDRQDFIYADRLIETIRIGLFELVAKLKNMGFQNIRFGQLPADSLTRQLFKRNESESYAESESVCVNFEGLSYGDWFESLGKHSRQNVRTAFNRLERHHRQYKLEVYSKSGVGESLCGTSGGVRVRLCRRIYERRLNKRYFRKNNIATRLLYKYFSYVSLSVPGDNGFLSVLLIDNKIAGFMEGYMVGRTVEIPRLAINDEFLWYSPGLVLVSQTIKFLCENTQVRVLDLCRGTEKYKFDMGGGVYKTMDIKYNF